MTTQQERKITGTRNKGTGVVGIGKLRIEPDGFREAREGLVVVGVRFVSKALLIEIAGDGLPAK